MPEDSDDGVWRLNYFNYFTEVEEQFQRARATGLFLLSPLDWALIESWKNAGIPMEAVLRGIQVAFDQWRAKKHKTQMVNSLTYCAQAVMKEAELMAKNRHRRPRWTRNRRSLESASTWKSRDAPVARGGYEENAAGVAGLLANLEEQFTNLEELDQAHWRWRTRWRRWRGRGCRTRIVRMRRELDRTVAPYRGKMTADQLARLGKSFLDRKVYEHRAAAAELVLYGVDRRKAAPPQEPSNRSGGKRYFCGPGNDAVPPQA